MANGNGKFNILQPIFQYGFAGLCGVLLIIMCWQMNCRERQYDKLLEMQSETNQVIERNTSAIQELGRIVHDKL